MKRSSNLLVILWIILCIAGCGAKTGTLTLPSLDGSSLQSLGEEEIQNLKRALSSESLPESFRLLTLVEMEQDGEKERFRAAIQAKSDGRFRIQILPTTSLMVLQTIDVTPDSIEIADSKESEEYSLSKRNLKFIFGEVIHPREFYAILLGRLPNSGVFSDLFLNGSAKSDGTLGVWHTPLNEVFFHMDKTAQLQGILLRESSKEREILRVRFSQFEKVLNSLSPMKLELEFVRKELQLKLEYRRLSP